MFAILSTNNVRSYPKKENRNKCERTSIFFTKKKVNKEKQQLKTYVLKHATLEIRRTCIKEYYTVLTTY